MKTVSPYKSAAELGIHPWEHDRLAALVGPLCRGEIRLDMRIASFAAATCGTVACIGGHIALAHGMSLLAAARYVDDFRRTEGWPDGSLTQLFFPTLPTAWACTAPQAGVAVMNFLTLGEPRWDDVMRRQDGFAG